MSDDILKTINDLLHTPPPKKKPSGPEALPCPMDSERGDKCQSMVSPYTKTHKGLHKSGTLRWGYEPFGAPYPKAPDPLTVLMSRAQTPLAALEAVAFLLDAEYQQVLSSNQEYGWFQGFADAAEILDDAIKNLKGEED